MYHHRTFSRDVFLCPQEYFVQRVHSLVTGFIVKMPLKVSAVFDCAHSGFCYTLLFSFLLCSALLFSSLLSSALLCSSLFSSLLYYVPFFEIISVRLIILNYSLLILSKGERTT